MDKSPVTVSAPEKRRFRLPRGKARLWQLAVCLLFFLAALFLRAFSDFDASPLFSGAVSLRELALQAGQALGRSTLAEAFAKGFGETYTGAAAVPQTSVSPTTVLTKPAAQTTLPPAAAPQTTAPQTTVPQTTVAVPKPAALPDNVSASVPAIAFSYTAPLSGRITSAFGYRIHPVDGDESFHYGIDIAAAEGTDVCAFAGGRVIYAGVGEINGKYMKIEHADGIVSMYAHLSAFEVCVGDTVEEGQVIARSGSTGKVTGPHLHFQLYADGLLIDPASVLGELPET